MENKNKTYGEIAIKKLDKSQIEITGSVPCEIWEKYRENAVKNLSENISIDGFRKGMIPENVLISKIGEMAVLDEMAELAIPPAYVSIIIDNKIDAIGKPSVQITKLAKGNPLEFRIVTAIIPELTLPEYKDIASKEVTKAGKEKIEVSDKDVEDAILEIRKSRASHEGHDHEKMTPEEHEKAILDSLPEFNDEFVRGLGDDFKSVDDFKIKVREMIGENKKREAKEKMRIRISDALVDAIKLELPDVLVESELNRTEAQFKDDVERMGVKMDDYLKHAKKTIEDVRKEWRPYAEKKARLQLILNAIAAKEKISPDNNEIEAEIKHIMQHYKDAKEESVRVYAETILSNEKVYQFLEQAKN